MCKYESERIFKTRQKIRFGECPCDVEHLLPCPREDGRYQGHLGTCRQGQVWGQRRTGIPARGNIDLF